MKVFVSRSRTQRDSLLFCSLFFLLQLLGGAECLSAEPRISRNIKANGSVQIIQVPAGYPHRSLTVYFPSTGNETLLADFIFRGPRGTSVTARAGIKKGKGARKSFPLEFLKNDKELRSLRLTGEEVAAARPELSGLRTALLSSESSNDPCESLTQPIYDETRAILRPILLRDLTNQEICQLYRDAKSGTPNPISFTTEYSEEFPATPSIEYINNQTKLNKFNQYIPRLNGISEISRLRIRKDSCSQSPRAQYQVELVFSFDKVSQDTITQGFALEVGVNAANYRGDKASSIKPVSEGKFAPQPLFLMTAIGGFKHRVHSVRWSGNRPKVVGSRDSADFVFWRRHFLTRTPAGSLLRGGRATVELSNGSEAYSVCFELRARRQNVAGYGR